MAEVSGDHKQLLTEIIQKQIIILGPQIALMKARNVEGLEVLDDGTVSEIRGDPNMITQKLIDQYISLSGMIVKKTMEPLLAKYPGISENVINNPIANQGGK